MPEYRFSNPNNDKEYIDVFFHMDDNKAYIRDGIKWNRIFTIPQSSIDTKVDAWDSKSFLKATNKKGTIGELMDRSSELSEKRGGRSDPLKQKYYENYSKKRGGNKLHPDVLINRAKSKLDKMGVIVE